MSIRPFVYLIILCMVGSCTDVLQPSPLPLADNGGLILPDGFGALIVSDSVGPCRHLAVNHNGDIYVKLKLVDGDKGNIALRDTDGDGKADIAERFGNYPNDGNFATEMRIHKGYLYFSSEKVIYRQKLTPDALIPKGNPEVIVIDKFPIRWHNAKSLAFDKEGGLYVTFSAPTNVCEDWNSVPENIVANVKGEYPCEQLIDFGGIWRFDEAKKNQYQHEGKRYATGLRSVVAMSWRDEDNSLYGFVHGRDYLYGHAPQYFTPWDNAVLPSEEFVIIKEGNNFGWPYTYYDHFQNKRLKAPEYGGDGKMEATGYNDPLMGMPAHWAPNDMLFYKGNQFPERYKNGAFVAFHGSTNRSPYPQAGYIVAFIPFENGKPNGTFEVFADGFIGKDTIADMSEAKYRPMGLAEGPDGSIYISESKVGKIWRVLYTGQEANFGSDQLAKMEARKSQSYIKTPDEKKDILSLNTDIKPELIYSNHCAGCHGLKGEGVESIYPPLAGSEWVNGDNKKLIDLMVNGLKGEIIVKGKKYNQIMPSCGFLSDTEIANVINYIKNNFGNQGGNIQSKDVLSVRSNQ